MATIGNIINLEECGLNDVYGTGTRGCKLFIEKTVSLWVVPDGFTFDSSETLNETYAQVLQAQGNLIVLKGVKAFTDNSADDIFETLPDGTKQIATLGLYEFGATFINGLYFHSALHSLNSFSSFNILFVDRSGNILGTQNSDGELMGFSTNYLQGMRLMFPTDTTGQKEGIGFQLADRSELDTNFAFVSGNQLGTFQPQQLDGINDVVLSLTAPSDSATSLVVTAKTKQNQKAWTGGVLANFLVQVDGATITPSGVAESPDGTYTFTVAAVSTGEVVTVQLYDSSNSRAVIESDNVLYKSNTTTATVVA